MTLTAVRTCRPLRIAREPSGMVLTRAVAALRLTADGGGDPKRKLARLNIMHSFRFSPTRSKNRSLKRRTGESTSRENASVLSDRSKQDGGTLLGTARVPDRAILQEPVAGLPPRVRVGDDDRGAVRPPRHRLAQCSCWRFRSKRRHEAIPPRAYSICTVSSESRTWRFRPPSQSSQT